MRNYIRIAMPQESAAATSKQHSRYYIKRCGFRWAVFCGSGTEVIFASFFKTTALRMASRLECAYLDGKFIGSLQASK